MRTTAYSLVLCYRTFSASSVVRDLFSLHYAGRAVPCDTTATVLFVCHDVESVRESPPLDIEKRGLDGRETGRGEADNSLPPQQLYKGERPA